MLYKVYMIVAALLVQSASVQATPESEAAALFLVISPSVRVNGMGQAGVALADEPGGYYNPGAAALSAAGPTFQSQFYLREMPWIVDDTLYSYFATQASASRIFDGLSWRGSTSLGAAFYGYRTKLDHGQLPRWDNTGTFRAADTANNFGVSLALRSMVDLGVGGTFKQILSKVGELKGSARTYDFGLMVVLPVARALERLTEREIALNQHLRPKLDLGFGAAWHNRGGATITYYDPSIPYPLPANRRFGWSGSLSMDWSNDSVILALGKITFTEETYRPQLEGVKVTEIIEIEKSGLEISILETLSFRRGEYGSSDDSIHLNTSGVTINSDGPFKIMDHALSSAPASSSIKGFRSLFKHLSVVWSRFEYDMDEWWLPTKGHSSISLSLCLRNCGSVRTERAGP